MTFGRSEPPHPEPPLLLVVGIDADGVEVVRLVLGHGEDPTVLLAGQGWEVTRAREAASHVVGRHVLTLSFVVERRLPVEPPAVASVDLGVPASGDTDLVAAEGEIPQPHQRVAAYALVTCSRGVLMTQFSGRTNAEGTWGLPGGGLEGGEAPGRAVLREVWEESGQKIEVNELALVRTSRWIGRAPTGRLEDFHSVRLVYRAWCHTPTHPVVHDIGGTTAAAAWVPPTDLDRLEMTSGWRSLMSGLVVASDEADGPEHDQHETDAHDGARPEL